eukprot:TRINITY_DN5122_c0_g1_i1.p1 TRINITY_DN5122_c0_g1~~TRINITY_DN5122_c0_g1_i1.p1  ORF type:complete len:389 (+),score=74.85 TRINITY_DN5122_c0_g1_i1:228-1394(+)
MKQLFFILGALLVLSYISQSQGATCTVTNAGGGDDTNNIVTAFNNCKSNGVIIFSAGKTYHFNTPGTTLATLSGTTVSILGSIVFPASTSFSDVSYYMTFKGSNVVINGTGDLDGNGQVYWNAGKTGGPKLVKFQLTGSSSITGISIHDSPAQHVSVNGCNGCVFRNLNVYITWSRIQSGKKASNTDGFDIGSSSNVQIINTKVDNGDDEVAINGGVYNLLISGMNCSNGHGISIGSLGKSNANDIVDGVVITNTSFYNTQHSVRIKTFLVSPGNTGYAQNITYSNLSFHGNTEEPICITQKYCNNDDCGNGTVAFNLKGATFSNFSFNGMNLKYDMVSIWCVSNNNCGPWKFTGVTLPSSSVVGCYDVSGTQISGLTCQQTLSSACN